MPPQPTPGDGGAQFQAQLGGYERRITALETALRLAQVQLVTTLPTNPYDGQLIDFVADSINGVLWRFRYRAASSSSYKWEAVGCSPLMAENTGNDAGFTNNGGSPVAVANGPQITLPLAGDYVVDWSADMVNAASGNYTYTAPWNAGSGSAGAPIYNATTLEVEMAKRQRLNSCTATILQLRRWVSAGTGTVWQASMSAFPVRVG